MFAHYFDYHAIILREAFLVDTVYFFDINRVWWVTSTFT